MKNRIDKLKRKLRKAQQTRRAKKILEMNLQQILEMIFTDLAKRLRDYYNMALKEQQRQIKAGTFPPGGIRHTSSVCGPIGPAPQVTCCNPLPEDEYRTTCGCPDTPLT